MRFVVNQKRNKCFDRDQNIEVEFESDLHPAHTVDRQSRSILQEMIELEQNKSPWVSCSQNAVE